jgi:hypothetical protein
MSMHSQGESELCHDLTAMFEGISSSSFHGPGATRDTTPWVVDLFESSTQAVIMSPAGDSFGSHRAD